MATINGSDSHMTNYLNNLGYENYIWKTKYNELWTNFLALMEENKRLQAELNDCNSKVQNQTELQSIQQTLENDAASGNRNPLIEYLQKKNAELISIIIQKDSIIATLQKNIPNAPVIPPPNPHPPVPHIK
jgi:predicted  nucleic acid-binding Zn-ribbon protein